MTATFQRLLGRSFRRGEYQPYAPCLTWPALFLSLLESVANPIAVFLTPVHPSSHRNGSVSLPLFPAALPPPSPSISGSHNSSLFRCAHNLHYDTATYTDHTRNVFQAPAPEDFHSIHQPQFRVHTTHVMVRGAGGLGEASQTGECVCINR